MCLRFVFLLTTRALSWLRMSGCDEAWKTAEILILDHHLAVLQRRQPRRDLDKVGEQRSRGGSRRRGPAGPSHRDDAAGAACGGAGLSRGGRDLDCPGLAQQQLVRSAAEHGADDLQVIEADGGRLAGPQRGHLARADSIASLIGGRDAWPLTANRHLLLSQLSALQDSPVSSWWISERIARWNSTLTGLRQDRILEEAAAAGTRDPMHLASMFGLHPNTAQRYVEAVYGRHALDQ